MALFSSSFHLMSMTTNAYICTHYASELLLKVNFRFRYEWLDPSIKKVTYRFYLVIKCESNFLEVFSQCSFSWSEWLDNLMLISFLFYDYLILWEKID